MAKVSLANHMKERRSQPECLPERMGPFVTISRQFGCYGFSLGLPMMEILNEDAPAERTWHIYNREILEQLATETNLAAEMLDGLRREKPSLIVDFFRALSMERIPSGYEIRNRITTIIRGLAIKGYAILVGQGGSAATADLPNGISVRLEAPEDWRVKQIAHREGISLRAAKAKVQAMEEQREHLRRIYQESLHRDPPFDIVYDCSSFTLAQIAQHVVYAMKLMGCVC